MDVDRAIFKLVITTQRKNIMIEIKYLDAIRARLAKTSKCAWIPYIEGRDFTSGSSFIMTMTTDSRGDDIDYWSDKCLY